MFLDMKRSASVMVFFQWCKDYIKNYFGINYWYKFTYKTFDGKTASLVVNSDVIHALKFQL